MTLAALENAIKVVDKKMGDLKIVIAGVGAAGVAITKILLDAGCENIIGVDRKGAIFPGRSDLNAAKLLGGGEHQPRAAQGRDPRGHAGRGRLHRCLGPRAHHARRPAVMHRDPIVFAMSNPDPEISPEAAEGYVAVMATGRSDYPNQINNVLAFPGIFRGALDAGATQITEGDEARRGEAIARTVATTSCHPVHRSQRVQPQGRRAGFRRGR